MPIPTYTYICWDSVTRTRCRDHIPTIGPRRPLPKPHHQAVRSLDGLPRCYECTVAGVDTGQANTIQLEELAQ